VLALGLLLLAAPAGTVDLEWDAPAGCPTSAQVVERILAQSDASAEPRSLTVVGVVRQPGPRRFTLTLELTTRSPGEEPTATDRRTLEGETCDALTDAAALIIALGLDAAAETTSAVPEPDPVVPTPPQPAVDRTDEAGDPPSATAPEPARSPATRGAASAPPAPARDPGPALEGWVSAAAGVAGGILPGVGAGVAVEGGVQGRGFRVGISARGLPARSTRHPESPDVSGRFDLVTGGVLACGVPSAARWSFPLCGQLQAGALRGVGRGAVARPRAQWSPWVGLTASASVAWRALRWLAPFLTAEGVVAAMRPGFTVGPLPGTIYEAGRFGGRVWAGVEFRISPRSPAGSR
jgi:hypothetical protein